MPQSSLLHLGRGQNKFNEPDKIPTQSSLKGRRPVGAGEGAPPQWLALLDPGSPVVAAACSWPVFGPDVKMSERPAGLPDKLRTTTCSGHDKGYVSKSTLKPTS